MIFIISFIAIVFAYYFMQKDRIRREEMRNKQQELLDRIRAKRDKDMQDNNQPSPDKGFAENLFVSASPLNK